MGVLIASIIGACYLCGCTPQAIGPNYLMEPNTPINITINLTVEPNAVAVSIPVSIHFEANSVPITIPVTFAPVVNVENHLLKTEANRP